jgi:hypothetical protein
MNARKKSPPVSIKQVGDAIENAFAELRLTK